MNKKKIFLSILIATSFVVGLVWYATEPRVVSSLTATTTPAGSDLTSEKQQVPVFETAQKKSDAPSVRKPIIDEPEPYDASNSRLTAFPSLSEITPPVDEEINTAVFSVDGKQYSAEANDGATLLEVMRLASESSDLKFSGREYPGMGMFVETINGKKNGGGYYWILHVNGKSSYLGVSSVVAHPGDTIEWNYEKGY